MVTRLHLELTSRCVLACPSCSRTVWSELTKKHMFKNDLNIEHFKKFLDCEAGSHIDTFTLCGDYGDALYYPNLIEFLDEFKDKAISLHTNGSSQKPEFWHKLAARLSNKDTVTFGIDGLYEDNTLYRRNANWNSIMTGMDILRNNSDVNINWATLIFKFNQDKLDEIRQFAESKGAKFIPKPSHRFDGIESMRPTDSQNVEVQFLYQDEYHKKDPININPRCLNAMAVGSDGYFYPCDWIRNPMSFYKSPLWKDKEKWLERLNIANTDLNGALTVMDEWRDFVKQSGLNGTAEVLCKMKCRKGANV
jgi:MoaA/NifB/PqqE/SkfB family radical SAM enzyme